MSKFFTILFSLAFSIVCSQSLTGTNGLFKTPSAYILTDGNAYVGASFYPKGYYELYNKGNRFTGMPTFVTLSLYDRIEFMFRYTHQLGQKVSPRTRYFPDRMFTLRYNLLKERSNFPSISLGLHDVSEALGGTSAYPWFLSTYLVGTKSIEFHSFIFVPSIGYSYDIFGDNRSQVFDGLFGGVELFSKSLPYASFVLEFDSENYNAAIKSQLFDHLFFSFGFIDMKAPAGYITYRFNLSSQ